MQKEEIQRSIRTLIEADPESIDKIENNLLRKEAKKIRNM